METIPNPRSSSRPPVAGTRLRHASRILITLRIVTTLAFVPLLLQGCGALGYDNREKIAHAILYDEKGVFDANAFSAALIAKFANANSPPASLIAFVESIGGKCSISPEEKDSMHCSIPQSGSFCVANEIQLFVTTSNGAISNLSAKARFDGC